MSEPRSRQVVDALVAAMRTRDGRRAIAAWTSLAFLGVLTVLLTGGSLVAGGVFGCEGCHAMEGYAAAHAASPHEGTGCRDCHTRTGLAAAVVAAPRGVRWVSSAVIGRSAAPVETDDGPCRDCHAGALAETVDTGGLRVRHSDFSEIACRMCHAGTAHVLGGRHYLGPQMEDCTGCHRTSATRVETCDTCHVGSRDRGQGASAWRAVHGAGWAEAHGMGDLGGCVDCHTPSYCARCHGLAMPHPANWATSHAGTAVQDRTSCQSCHDPDWCAGCHGVEMPHAAGFIARHPDEVASSGPQVCYRCHALTLCESCHVKSSHPLVPGVRADAHGGGDR